MESELEDEKKSFNLFRAIYNQSNIVLILGSSLLSIWTIILWLLPHIDYLPDWFPVPSTSNALINTVKCFQPIVLSVLGIPTLLAFIFEFAVSINFLVKHSQTHGPASIGLFISSLLILAIPIVLWLSGKQIDNFLLNYGVSRYDRVINAIEEYKNDEGEYPPNLDTLVPKYLPNATGIYMKFGNRLTYEPKPYAWYDHSPFTFELRGQYLSLHGQVIKYCPIDTCFEGDRPYKRINDKWILFHLSAL